MSKEFLHENKLETGHTVGVIAVESRGGKDYYSPKNLRLVVVEPEAEYRTSRSPGVDVLKTVEYNKLSSQGERSHYGKTVREMSETADQIASLAKFAPIKEVASLVSETSSTSVYERAIGSGKQNLVDATIKALGTSWTDGQGRNLVHYASKHNQPGVIEQLGREGADVNLPDSNGKTPAHIASNGGHLEALQALSKAKANLHLLDRDGNTTLHLASARQDGREAVSFLLEKGLSPFALNASNQQPSGELCERARNTMSQRNASPFERPRIAQDQRSHSF